MITLSATVSTSPNIAFCEVIAIDHGLRFLPGLFFSTHPNCRLIFIHLPRGF